MLDAEESGKGLLEFLREAAGCEPEIERRVYECDHFIVVKHPSGIVDIGLPRHEAGTPLPEPVDLPDLLKYLFAKLLFALIHTDQCPSSRRPLELGRCTP